MNPLRLVFEKQLQLMALTLRHGTIKNYRVHANRFLRYLHSNHPDLKTPQELQRNPHILGWFQSLAGESPPLSNKSRRAALTCIRRLLDDLAFNGYPMAPALILSQDLPPRDRYLPKPVSPEVDRLLDRELRRVDDLLSNALLLMRATGLRIGECLGLARDCLRHPGPDQWALHVPLGKLHSERWVPMDSEAHRILERILSLTSPLDSDFLLTLPNGSRLSYDRLRKALRQTSLQAGCPPVRPHQLRHTFATSMVRSGISLPVLKEILGHRDIRMTMAYIQVTQNDMQREYHKARRNMASTYSLTQLPAPAGLDVLGCEITCICHTLDELRHQMQMWRRKISNQNKNRKIHSLDRRLAKIRKTLATFS